MSEKISTCRKRAAENLTVPPPCTPLQDPLRGMECNSQPLSASSEPLSVIPRCRKPTPENLTQL